jgi:hypothetical protein
MIDSTAQIVGISFKSVIFFASQKLVCFNARKNPYIDHRENPMTAMVIKVFIMQTPYKFVVV